MSNSRKKMDVVVKPTKFGKDWAVVTLKNGNSFMPSFEDLHRIIQAIAFCEDRKYPNGAGRIKLAQFLFDCVMEENFINLAKEYNIPIRCGNIVVNSNGAKLKSL